MGDESSCKYIICHKREKMDMLYFYRSRNRDDYFKRSHNRNPMETLKLETTEWLSQGRGTRSVKGREIFTFNLMTYCILTLIYHVDISLTIKKF